MHIKSFYICILFTWISTWGDCILWAKSRQAAAAPSGVALTASQNCLMVLTSSSWKRIRNTESGSFGLKPTQATVLLSKYTLFEGLVALKRRSSRLGNGCVAVAGVEVPVNRLKGLVGPPPPEGADPVDIDDALPQLANEASPDLIEVISLYSHLVRCAHFSDFCHYLAKILNWGPQFGGIAVGTLTWIKLWNRGLAEYSFAVWTFVILCCYFSVNGKLHEESNFDEHTWLWSSQYVPFWPNQINATFDWSSTFQT